MCVCAFLGVFFFFFLGGGGGGALFIICIVIAYSSTRTYKENETAALRSVSERYRSLIFTQIVRRIVVIMLRKHGK